MEKIQKEDSHIPKYIEYRIGNIIYKIICTNNNISLNINCNQICAKYISTHLLYTYNEISDIIINKILEYNNKKNQFSKINLKNSDYIFCNYTKYDDISDLLELLNLQYPNNTFILVYSNSNEISYNLRTVFIN